MTHVCASEIDHYYFKQWLVACSTQSHNLNECWLLVNENGFSKMVWNSRKLLCKCRLQNVDHFVWVSKCRIMTRKNQPCYLLSLSRPHAKTLYLTFIKCSGDELQKVHFTTLYILISKYWEHAVMYYSILTCKKWKRLHMILVNDLWNTYQSNGNLISITISKCRVVPQTEGILNKNANINSVCQILTFHNTTPSEPWQPFGRNIQ